MHTHAHAHAHTHTHTHTHRYTHTPYLPLYIRTYCFFITYQVILNINSIVVFIFCSCTEPQEEDGIDEDLPLQLSVSV